MSRPVWHAATGKVLAVGAQVRYSPKGEQLEDRPRANQTAYAVFDPKSGRWTPWRRLEMPADDSFNFARSACAQFVVEPDGSVLLPFYIGAIGERPLRRHGRSLHLRRRHADLPRARRRPVAERRARALRTVAGRALGGRYFLTIRNDLKGYVTASDDGLHYRPVKPWTFDDGRSWAATTPSSTGLRTGTVSSSSTPAAGRTTITSCAIVPRSSSPRSTPSGCT